MLTTLKEDTERSRLRATADYDMLKYKVYWYDPKVGHLTDVRVYLSSDATLEETLENVYNRFKVKGMASVQRCRLVAYDSNEENVYCSFDGKDQEQIRNLMSNVPIHSDLLLEIREENSNFEVIAPGGIQTKVYTVDMETSDIDGPIIVRAQKTSTVGEYKEALAAKLKMDPKSIIVAYLKFDSYASLLENESSKLSDEDLHHKSKIFVAHKIHVENISAKFLKIVERFHLIISLHFTLPKTDKGNFPAKFVK